MIFSILNIFIDRLLIANHLKDSQQASEIGIFTPVFKERRNNKAASQLPPSRGGSFGQSKCQTLIGDRMLASFLLPAHADNTKRRVW